MTRSLSLVLAVACSRAVAAATLPAGFSEFVITGGHRLSNATAMEFSPDGKLFVLEQAGTIEIFEGVGATAWTRRQANFFANTPLNVNSLSERGLLGIAFDPDYLVNRFVYVYYTRGSAPLRNRIARYTANGAGDLALAGSAVTLMNLDPIAGGGNHNGGAMHFGPGGALFVAVGDDGNSSNAQTIDNRFGKILRLSTNPDHPIPASNPAQIDGIAGTTSGANRAIWCAGLRNPYTFAFKPGTNIMYINDVGQNTWEEINVGAAGANFGWGLTEGPFNQGAFPFFRRPRVYYHHDDDAQSFPQRPGFTGLAIAGGAFYNPPNVTFPAGYVGDYFFADFISGWIKRYDPVNRTIQNFASAIDGPVDLRAGADGALYYLERGSGSVVRVQRNGFPFALVGE